jgi:hypothetical protein
LKEESKKELTTGKMDHTNDHASKGFVSSSMDENPKA